MTTTFALAAVSAGVAAAAMVQLGLRSRQLAFRRTRRCHGCGRVLATRVCQRCQRS